MLKKKRVKHKFCPICGTKLDLDDRYCTKCGYSFEARSKKSKKKIKWKNIIILIIILAIIYVGFQYFSGQPIIPDSLTSFLNATNSS